MAEDRHEETMSARGLHVGANLHATCLYLNCSERNNPSLTPDI